MLARERKHSAVSLLCRAFAEAVPRPTWHRLLKSHLDRYTSHALRSESLSTMILLRGRLRELIDELLLQFDRRRQHCWAHLLSELPVVGALDGLEAPKDLREHRPRAGEGAGAVQLGEALVRVRGAL